MRALWTDALARRLADALPDAVARSVCTCVDPDVDPREELRARARTDFDLRRRLMDAWRAGERALVAATERLAPEELAAAWQELARAFDDERLVLALLTEADEDTGEAVEHLLAALPGGSVRKRIAALRDALLVDAPAPSGLRLAVVGGLTTERARVDALAQRHGCRVYWIPAGKERGFGPAQTALGDLASCDAVLVVTGRISHTLMRGARRAAERLGVPCLYLERLSDRQVADALATLQPGERPLGRSR